MKAFFKKIFLDNWQRKSLSLILAIISWIVVNHSMVATKTLSDIPIKFLNLPPGKTVEGLLPNQFLNKTLSLTLTGEKSTIEKLSCNDIEILIDAKGKGEEWQVIVSPQNLLCPHHTFDLAQEIRKVVQNENLNVKLTPLITEKIPVLVTEPIGQAPKGFQFLDIWPYRLYLTVTGPEEKIKQLKAKGLRLTFNLNNITENELQELLLAQHKKDSSSDEVSFFIPSHWKKISLPEFSLIPLEIDDPLVKTLRIDFVQKEMIPIKVPIALSLFFPLRFSEEINPEHYSLATNAFIEKKNGIPRISASLFARGVSRAFIDIVKNMLQIVVLVLPKGEKEYLPWNVQFIYPQELEDRYVTKALPRSLEEEKETLQPNFEEEYLRNRFRKYMNNFRLYTPEDQKLSLKIELRGNQVVITPQNLGVVPKLLPSENLSQENRYD